MTRNNAILVVENSLELKEFADKKPEYEPVCFTITSNSQKEFADKSQKYEPVCFNITSNSQNRHQSVLLLC